MLVSTTSDLWGRVAATVDGARRDRDLEVCQIARTAGLDDSTVRRVLAAEPVRLSSLRLVLRAVGLEWDELLLTLAHAN